MVLQGIIIKLDFTEGDKHDFSLKELHERIEFSYKDIVFLT
jgi:hypothetical protein